MVNPESKKRPHGLLTTTEVAQMCHCHHSKIRELAKRNIIKGMKFSQKTTYYRPEEVEAFMAWAEGKDLTDPDRIIDMSTGKTVVRFVE